MKNIQIICDGELVAICPSEATALRVATGLADYDILDIFDGEQHYCISDDETRLVPCEAP